MPVTRFEARFAPDTVEVGAALSVRSLGEAQVWIDGVAVAEFLPPAGRGLSTSSGAGKGWQHLLQAYRMPVSLGLCCLVAVELRRRYHCHQAQQAALGRAPAPQEDLR